MAGNWWLGRENKEENRETQMKEPTVSGVWWVVLGKKMKKKIGGRGEGGVGCLRIGGRTTNKERGKIVGGVWWREGMWRGTGGERECEWGRWEM